MSSLASFEFRHLRRHLSPEETIPPFPSLVQQVEALVADARRAVSEAEAALEDEALEALERSGAEEDIED